MTDEPMTPVRSNYRRLRRWLTGILVTLVVLASLRLAAPWILDVWLSARLGKALGVPVHIDHVALELLAGEVTARGIQAAPAAETSATTVAIDAITVRWSWRDLVRGARVLDVEVAGLDATLDLHRPWPADFGERNHGGLLWLRSLVVVDSAVGVVLAADAPPILTLTELQASLVETSMEMRTEAMTTRFTISAQAGEAGHLKIDGAVAPIASASTWTLHFALDRLDLRALNPLFQAVFEMDVEHGWLSLTGDFTVGLGRLRGKIQPRFEELALLGRGEQRVRHPMAEALFGSMLSGADLPIDIDQPAVSTGASLFASLGKIDPMDLLTRVILNGFIRRLGTIDGYEAGASRLVVDFPAGALSFFDVTLKRSGGLVDRPFVHVGRMDIVVEQTAVDDDVLTYKMISLHQPTLIFVTGPTEARSQLTIDPDWQAKVSVLPYPTDRLEVFGGRLEYRDETTEPPTSFFVSGLEVRADNLGRALVGSARRDATLIGRARVMDLSPLALDVVYSPGAVPLDAAVKIHLDPLPLDQLNELLRGRLGIDISGGTLALEADLDVHADHLRGTVRPALRGVRVIGSRELEIDHPLRELLFERRLRRLDGAVLKLDYRVRKTLVRELPGALLYAALHAD